MIDQIRRVADLREKGAALGAEWKEEMGRFMEAHQALREKITAQAQALSEAEDDLRAAAIAEYQATNNKAPAPGVEIKMMKRLAYLPSQALDWAIKHGLALNLNVKTFEQVARTTAIDCVTITEEPFATIATDLRKALEGKT